MVKANSNTGGTKIVAYYMAKSLATLLKQINEKFPARSKASDGWVGDTSHSRRKSDHNPDASGCVCALDLTHDPRSGMDSYILAQALIDSGDRRISYVISNGRIANPKVHKGAWRPYSGINPHNHHVHISVIREHADEGALWDLSHMAGKKTSAYVPPPGTIKLGSVGGSVGDLQRRLGLPPDGFFGSKTKKAVAAFQKANGLLDDGVVGPATWAKLKGGGL